MDGATQARDAGVRDAGVAIGHNPQGVPIADLEVQAEVTGTVMAVRARGIWFDIGATKWGMMPVRLYSRNQPEFEIGDIVEGLRIEQVDVSQQRFTLSGVGVVFTAPSEEYAW